MNNDIIAQVNVEDEMRESYLSYAMSVIASRALPDVRDGLKPVQRRILYAMREMGMDPAKQHRKCAGIIGEVLKSYHPHGDSSVYDALVRMAQDFTLRYPLVDGHGNFGSIDPDPPAAYRYTEARLARTALDVLADIDKETVRSSPTSTIKASNRACCRDGCRSCSSTARAASRSAWRPTFRRTTSARSPTPSRR